jgi:hypothetical protein
MIAYFIGVYVVLCVLKVMLSLLFELFEDITGETKYSKKIEERKQEEPKVDSSEKNEENISTYITKLIYLYSNNICDEDVKSEIASIIENLRILESIRDKDIKNKNVIDRFADKYLPVIIDNTARFSNMRAYNSDIYVKTKENIIRTLRMFNVAVEKNIEQISDSEALEIDATNQALQAVLKLSQLPRPIKGRCLPKLRVSLNGYRVCSSPSQS